MSFDERQWFFANPLLWWVAPVVVVAVAASVAQGADFGPSHVLALVLLAAVLFANLRTRVDEDAVYLTFFPVMWRKIRIRDIASARLIPYEWQKFGGWGIRLGQRSIAYVTSGKTAVRLQLEGRDAVIGSKDCKALLAALRKAGVDAVDTTDSSPE